VSRLKPFEPLHEFGSHACGLPRNEFETRDQQRRDVFAVDSHGTGAFAVDT
jgi:hypothetical protein